MLIVDRVVLFYVGCERKLKFMLGSMNCVRIRLIMIIRISGRMVRLIGGCLFQDLVWLILVGLNLCVVLVSLCEMVEFFLVVL